MRGLIAVVVAGLVSGCAATTTDFSTPVYDSDSHSIIADGFPVPVLNLPHNFSIATAPKSGDYDMFSFAGPDNKALDIGYMREAQTFQEAGTNNQGYSVGRLKKNTVYYRYHRGLYVDLISSPGLLNERSPSCGVGVILWVDGGESSPQMLIGYIEPWPCDEMDEFGNYHQYELRVAAYKLLGLI